MRIILEPTKSSTVTEDGATKVRLWRGFTENGAPVLAAVVGFAASKGTVTDPMLESVAVSPVLHCGTNGRTVLRTWDGQIAFGGWWV
jgi:hypothetical protein